MILRRNFPGAALVACLLCLASFAAAQRAESPETFKGRLSPVPINISMMATIAGSGSLTATLKGNQLTIEGTFEGLRSPEQRRKFIARPRAFPGRSCRDSS